MTEKKNEEIAVFRFGVIHEFVGGATLTRDERRRLLLDKCARKWVIPHSNTGHGSARIQSTDGSGDIETAAGASNRCIPRRREDQGKSRKFDDETIAIIINAKREKR